MKIYILTLHWVSNYGANLQALSTYSYLKEKGHEVVILDYRSPDRVKAYMKYCSESQNETHADFVQSNLLQTKKVETLKELVAVIKDNIPDLLIVGSDAVWVQKKGKKLTPYWLNDDSLDSLPTRYITLAISMMGTNVNTFPQWQKEEIRKTLNKFNYITLRDEWSLNQIKKIGYTNSLYSPDPVFLLKEKYLPNIQNEELADLINRNEKYIVVSISKQRFNARWFEYVKKQTNQKGFKLVQLPMPEGNHDMPCDICLKNPLSPSDWYKCIAHSQGYIGERFHAMITCLHNNIPFVIIDTYGNKLPSFSNNRSKIYDLAKRLNKVSYLIHKRNPLLNLPNYVYRKLNAHIIEKSRNEDCVKIEEMRDLVRKHIDNIILCTD